MSFCFSLFSLLWPCLRAKIRFDFLSLGSGQTLYLLVLDVCSLKGRHHECNITLTHVIDCICDNRRTFPICQAAVPSVVDISQFCEVQSFLI